MAANIWASARTVIASPWQVFALVIDNAEVPAADPVSVVTVLDRSGSMQFYDYVDITRQTSRQFIDLLSVDDSVGVVSFGDTGVEEYPGTGVPEPITGQPIRDAAIAAVDAIGFGGCTYMGAGIQQGGAMLAAAGAGVQDPPGAVRTPPTLAWPVMVGTPVGRNVPGATSPSGARDQTGRLRS